MTDAKTVSLSITDLSARIVAEAEQPAPDAAKILDGMQEIVALVGNAAREQDQQLRDQTFLVAEQSLVEHHDVAGLVKLLAVKAKWTGDRIAYGGECSAVLASATKDRLVSAKIAAAGFGSRRPLEALSRLSFLLTISAGTIVADRTWGYGVVRREDDFYRTFDILFDCDGTIRSIGFSFAVDSLTVIPPTHVLAVRHNDPAAFDKLCSEKPGEVVRLALRSYGDMPVSRLQTLLTGLVLPKGVEWKKFWASARSQLARDASVHVPPAAKKNENVELFSDAEKNGSARAAKALERFASCREPREILDEAAAYLRDPGAKQFTPEMLDAFRDRLAFVVKAAVADRRLGNRAKVQALLLAREAGLTELPVRLAVNDKTRDALLEEFAFTDDSCSTVDLLGTLCKPEIILDASHTLPAGRMEALLDQIPLEKDAAVARAFVSALPRMTASLVDHVAPRLLGGPAAQEFADMIRSQFAEDHVRDPEAAVSEDEDEEEEEAAGEDGAPAPAPRSEGLSLPLLRWVCHAQAVEKFRKPLYEIESPFAIASLASVALGFQAEKENLRMKNDLKRLFVAGRRDPDPKSKGVEIDEGCKWLFPLLSDMSAEERASIFVRIQGLEGVWEPLKKRHLVANLLKAWPELQVHVPKARKAAARGFFRENVTSPRTYREREAQYRHLMDVEMPQNRKDIEFAKGFGDLSENFEYESARSKERELVKRQELFEEDLKRVAAFDFAAVEQNGLVGLGSHVSLEMPDGSVREYSILGEWDSSPDLGIVSCSTPIAKALLDHREGDRIVLPSDGEEGPVCTIRAVTALPEAVLAWARG